MSSDAKKLKNLCNAIGFEHRGTPVPISHIKDACDKLAKFLLELDKKGIKTTYNL